MMPTKSNKTVAKSGFSAKPQPRPEAETVAAEPVSAEPVSAETTSAETTSAKTTSAETTPSKALTELQAQLDQAAKQEAALQKTIGELETTIADQAQNLASLQTQVKASASLQTTLEKAEAAARQLAALNNQLMEENTALKAAPAAAPEPQKSTALAAPQRSLSNLVHPVFPNGALPSGIADQEIGWFD
jgi:predicted RNase H-like nuclease (RuvC/YqgF family)